MIRATPIMESLTGIMIAGFIFYSGKLINSGELGINNFFSFLAAMMLAYQPIRSLATLNMTAYQGSAAAQRIFSVIDKSILIKNEENLPELLINNSEIEFKNGSGKSTIINLIPRFYDPQSGKIFLDSQNIKEVKLDSLRKNISLVSQDVVLFDSTIRENILYANPAASDNELKLACDYAAANEFIDKLPKKYETIVGENGVKLSGGQKQRISIARAILKKSPIILLDEATSALDNESEKIVQHAINNLIKGKTTLIIAHRLSTIHNAEKILVMEEGKIIGTGNHEYLIKNNLKYKSLYESQLK